MNKNSPQRLIFEKVNIFTFAKDKNAAVYFCPQINQYYVLSSQNSNIKEDVFERLLQVEDTETIHFNDGSELDLKKENIQPVIELFNDIDEKDKFISYVSESSENFLKVLKYSIDK
jgi:hypothetical protein